MTFHKSNLGRYGSNLQCDRDGYVPTADTTPWELAYDHGGQDTHDANGELTEYGEWWERERWPEIVSDAVAATEAAERAVAQWRGDE